MTRNVAASVHQRLLNRARAEGRPFAELLQYYAMERSLYRLGCSVCSPYFVLKGALMFGAWQGPLSRPTRDVDLLGYLDNTVERVVEVIRAICQEPVPDNDGLRFQTENITDERITEAAEYQGVRVHLVANLGSARVRFQVDVGFGDPLVPGPTPVRLPTILDYPPPEVQGYSRESAIAEKFQSMVYLGEVNSRMKDFYDIWSLATRFAFEGPVLAQALNETFNHRQTALPAAPVALTAAFAEDKTKQTQWQAFLRRHRFDREPPTLAEAVQVIAAFLLPVVADSLSMRCC
ncbi:MAG: nucleotidyl transferase AbiEii/AbiGii toxin family protein [Anaerolineae bacterium]|nr:nucleotidyl transferase AbiEii/AbiGii toxin family protein [Anaerolineae bacterium]